MRIEFYAVIFIAFSLLSLCCLCWPKDLYESRLSAIQFGHALFAASMGASALVFSYIRFIEYPLALKDSNFRMDLSDFYPATPVEQWTSVILVTLCVAVMSCLSTILLPIACYKLRLMFENAIAIGKREAEKRRQSAPTDFSESWKLGKSQFDAANEHSKPVLPHNRLRLRFRDDWPPPSMPSQDGQN